jgi:hypothetical protein
VWPNSDPQSVDDGEDCGVGANAEREREDGDWCDAGIFD